MGIGASAGGLEAFSQLLGALPCDTGMAFVLVQHLDPHHSSLLAPVLAKTTRMPVTEIQNGMPLEGDHVYVIPPNTDLGLLKRVFVLEPREDRQRPHMAIDSFFRTLAAQEQACAIGVVLSGTGSDGTEGLRVIKGEGGITFAQTPASAKFAGMPEHAIKAGVVDNTLAPEEIARELSRLSRHPYLADRECPLVPDPANPNDEEALKQIFSLTRASSGIDYSSYRSTTIQRRIARRMTLHRLTSLEEYARLLEADAGELRILCKDMLIHVTWFFRDTSAFLALKEQVLPEIVRRHGDGSAIRIWVLGCSTGEEVYSIAITLLEVLDQMPERPPIQIFGSDVSADAIDRARAGLYPESASRDIGPERLKRFFVATEGGYRIGRPVRDLCVFARHDLAQDPPFVRLDLISCQNVLIYFGPGAQKRVAPLLYYCLNPEGYLLLGPADTVKGVTELFTSFDKANRIFTRTELTRSAALPIRDSSLSPIREGPRNLPDSSPPTIADSQRQVDHLLLARYAPPGVVVDAQMNVLQFRGRTAPFLELASGRPDLNLMKLARPELIPILHTAFQRAREEMEPVRREGVELTLEDGKVVLNLEITPVMGLPSAGALFLVLFEAVPAPPAAGPALLEAGPSSREPPTPAEVRQIARLKDEMAATKVYLQSLLDERQRINDALASTNDALSSGNEELQCTNEELETAKEELQSVNEELTTVNDELQTRNTELDQLNNDLVNLLSSVDIPIIIVSGERRIRRFTPRARILLNVLPTDIGRPLDDIKLNIDIPDLDQRISEVLDIVITRESEVQDRQGHWYRLQIRPYKTLDNRLDGAIVSLIDIDALKRAVGRAEEALEYVTGIVETIPVPLVVLDGRLCVLSANYAYFKTFGGSRDETSSQPFLTLGEGRWNTSSIREKLEEVLPNDAQFSLELEIEAPPGQKRLVTLSGSPIRWKENVAMILVTLVDVTERAALLLAAQAALTEAKRTDRSKDQFLATLSHELRTPLTSILLRASMLQREHVDLARARTFGEVIERAAQAQSQLINDLLDISRIASGKLNLQRGVVNLSKVLEAAIDTVRPQAEARKIQLRAEIDHSIGPIQGDGVRLQQVFWNLLGNAIKFTPPEGHVTVTLTRHEGMAEIGVSDTGTGIATALLPRIFDRYMQVDTSSSRRYGGLGLGLAIARDLVLLHGGTIVAESPGAEQGSTFTVRLPIPGEVSTGRAPDGDAPEGEAPEGDAPEGEGSTGAVSDGEAPEGEGSTGAVSDGEAPEGAVSEGAVSDGEGSTGAVSDGEGSTGAVSDGNAPDGEAPDGELSAAKGKDGSPEVLETPAGAQVGELEKRSAQVLEPLRGIRVLIVDDDIDVRETIVDVLTWAGAEVCGLASPAGVEGLLETFHPHVLLSDISMPGEDGYSMIRRIRLLPADRGGQIPAAAVSSLAHQEDKLKALEAGFQMHVSKPVSWEELDAAVLELAGKRIKPPV